MLTRSYLDPEFSKSLLAYTPMLHARLFSETQKFRDAHFQPTRPASGSPKPWLDGNPSIDRPLFVQFCANKPEELLEAARHVEPFCDAVDLNLGCPQGIARSGRYGAFLQEDWDTIYKLINCLHHELSIPVTAKIRILETKERTLEYAKMILSAGASIITVHGRRREQKGHNMGRADWSYIRYLRDSLPQDTVIFANGNILNWDDVRPCLEATGADAVMSAEGNLSDPAIFAKPPPAGQTSREYWRGRNGQEGYRIDGVVRRYMDIIYQYVLEITPPKRSELYLPGDQGIPRPLRSEADIGSDDGGRPMKKLKAELGSKLSSPSLRAMQGHLFQLLRPMLSTHTDIRDSLAKCRVGDISAFESVLEKIEDAITIGLQGYENEIVDKQTDLEGSMRQDRESSANAPSYLKDTIGKYKRPWWICQPHIRPLPEEALRIGALKLSKKELARVEGEKEASNVVITREDSDLDSGERQASMIRPELPWPALVCG
jgi:tRNA-dihydrouridine synthase 1